MSNQTTTKSRRSKGDGTIFKNSKGKWIARYTKKGVTTKEFSGKTKAEAKAKLDEYRFMVLSGEAVNTKLTVAEYSKKFLFYKSQQVLRKKLKQTTYDRIERTFECHIEKHPIAQVLMCNLKSRDIQNLLDELQPNYSLSTINKVYLFLHSMIKHGKEEKDFPESYNPFATVELPDETAVGKKTKEIQILPLECLERFKEVALGYNPDGTLAYRYGPALVFTLNTGLREGELLALSKNGILAGEDGRKRVHISETVCIVKNREENAQTKSTQMVTPPKYPRSNRIVPLNREAEMCLELMLNTYEPNKIRSDFIISTKTGNIPTKRNIQLSLDRILKRIGEKHYGTHAMRHTFATRLLSKTSSHQEIKAVAELLGDDYKVLVKTYLHTNEDGKHNLVDMLND